MYEAAYSAGATNGTWSTAYANVLADVEFLLPLAQKSNLQRHMGIAKTIKAMVLMDLVDTYGSVPFTEALNASNFSPKTDDGPSIYAAALKLLDEASVHFTATTSSGTPNDYFYARNYTRWNKLVNTLKLRYYLNTRLVNADASKSAINALISANALIGTGDDEVGSEVTGISRSRELHNNPTEFNGVLTRRFHAAMRIFLGFGRALGFGVISPAA